ncbi:MAG: (Fe-S)-binding protein [Candidatus Sedimenticola sp. 6PFRAG1]
MPFSTGRLHGTHPVNLQQILSEADHCVKCGLCLPHCPTYRITANEGDSPRGRIALIQAIAEGALTSPRADLHLDSCLGCRNCEPACPSGVKYGALIDSARQIQAANSGLKDPGVLWLASHAHKSWGISALRIYQNSGIRHLARIAGGEKFRRLDRLLPSPGPHEPKREIFPAAGKTRRRVGMFTGCVGRLADKNALRSATAVLNHLGIEVVMPADQRCCGAMHQHGGAPEKGEKLAEETLQTFNHRELDAIVTLASGCGAQLFEQLAQGSPDTPPVLDFSQFLMQLPWLTELNLKPLSGLALLHTPCTLRNVLGCPDDPLHALGLIPGLEIRPMPDTGCCGGAGTYMLSQPEMADSLRSPLIDSISSAEPDFVVTSNTGCALHLRAGLEQADSSIPVIHPAELIAGQLRPSRA